jgi:hypothetical protein
MIKDNTQLVEDVKIYSEGLITSIENGKIKESIEYVNKMRTHLASIKEYLEMKKSIPNN